MNHSSDTFYKLDNPAPEIFKRQGLDMLNDCNFNTTFEVKSTRRTVDTVCDSYMFFMSGVAVCCGPPWIPTEPPAPFPLGIRNRPAP